MNLRKNIKLLALIQIFLAILMAVPMIISYSFKEFKAANSFLYTIIAMILLSGAALLVFNKTELTDFRQRDGFFFVTFTWIIATAFGAIPLVASGDFKSYSAAFFEIMSGFTTTGATSLTDIEACGKGILFWRSMTCPR